MYRPHSSSVGEHLGHFSLLAIVTNGAVNMNSEESSGFLSVGEHGTLLLPKGVRPPVPRSPFIAIREWVGGQGPMRGLRTDSVSPMQSKLGVCCVLAYPVTFWGTPMCPTFDD